MEKKTYHKYFETSDFEKASLLNSAGCILDSVEWDHRSQIATFIFEENETCLTILDKHKRRDLWINSIDMIIAYREIKNELYSSRNK